MCCGGGGGGVRVNYTLVSTRMSIIQCFGFMIFFFGFRKFHTNTLLASPQAPKFVKFRKKALLVLFFFADYWTQLFGVCVCVCVTLALLNWIIVFGCNHSAPFSLTPIQLDLFNVNAC